jgi:hypothetical protein
MPSGSLLLSKYCSVMLLSLLHVFILKEKLSSHRLFYWLLHEKLNFTTINFFPFRAPPPRHGLLPVD